MYNEILTNTNNFLHKEKNSSLNSGPITNKKCLVEVHLVCQFCFKGSKNAFGTVTSIHFIADSINKHHHYEIFIIK